MRLTAGLLISRGSGAHDRRVDELGDPLLSSQRLGDAVLHPGELVSSTRHQRGDVLADVSALGEEVGVADDR